jgi:lysozyme
MDKAGVAADSQRKIGPEGIALIKQFEGCELTAYKDPVGILTIGYGSTGPHVKPGMTITEAEAEALLRKDLSRFEAAVEKLAGTASQGQFDAMVSLAFNIGEGAFGKSTLLKLHKTGNYPGAASEFGKWVRAGGKVLKGLVRRRAAEAELYRKGS